MSDEGPDSLALRILRRLDENVSRLVDDMGDVKIRLTNLEENQAAMNPRRDRVEARLDRIERRLDLVEPSGR